MVSHMSNKALLGGGTLGTPCHEQRKMKIVSMVS